MNSGTGIRTQDSRPPTTPTVLRSLFTLRFSPNPQRAESGSGGRGVRISHGEGGLLQELQSLTQPGPKPFPGWTRAQEPAVNLSLEGGLPGGGGISAEQE